MLGLKLHHVKRSPDIDLSIPEYSYFHSRVVEILHYVSCKGRRVCFENIKNRTPFGWATNRLNSCLLCLMCFYLKWCKSWWCHQMEIFSTLLAICAENSPVTGEFPAQRPVKRSFDVFFDLRLNEWLSKQSQGWWFETSSRPLWRHGNVIISLIWNEVHKI